MTNWEMKVKYQLIIKPQITYKDKTEKRLLHHGTEIRIKWAIEGVYIFNFTNYK